MTTKITTRAKPYSHLPVGTYRFLVDDDGFVRVFDDVAGHYTVCHSLSPRAQRRITDLARRASATMPDAD